MYTYIFMTSVRVIPVSAVLSRVPYGYVFLHICRIRGLHLPMRAALPAAGPPARGRQTQAGDTSTIPPGEALA